MSLLAPHALIAAEHLLLPDVLATIPLDDEASRESLTSCERVDDRNSIVRHAIVEIDEHVGINSVHAVRPVCNGVRRS